MAENNYMAMLDMGLRQTEQVFSRIDEAVTKSFALQENRRQAQAELELKGSQFAAEMAFNDRQLALEEQKNLVLANNYKLDNEIKSRRFVEEMKLQPLKEEAARMELEVARINRMTAFTKAKETQFSSLVGNIDSIAAGKIAESNDPALAEAYMALRSQEAASIGAGNRYDEAAFSSKVKNLFEGYEPKPLEGYQEGVASPLDKLSPNAAQRYRSANLPNAPSQYALESGFIMGGPEGAEMYLKSSYRDKQNTERDQQLVQAREGYQAAKNLAAMAQYEIKQLSTGINTIKDPEAKASQQKLIDEKVIERNNHDMEARKIFAEAMGVQIAPPPLTEEAAAAAEKELELDNLKAKADEQRRKVESGEIKEAIKKTKVSEADIAGPLKEKQQLIGDYTRSFGQAFGVNDVYTEGNFSFNYLYGYDARKDARAHAAPLVKNILTNLADVPLESKDGTKSIMDLIKEPAFAQIFKNLEGKSVTVDNPLFSMTNPINRKNADRGIAIGNRSITKFLDQGFDWNKSDQVEIESTEDFIEALKNSGFERYELELYAKKLYASVLAAGAIDKLSTSGE